MKTKLPRGFAVLAAVLICAAAADAEFADGVKINERVFNDFPGSTLVTTNNFPLLVGFDETSYGAGGFANRHDAILSDDGGASAKLLNTVDAFDVKADVTLNAGAVSPRKESGIRVNSGITGDGQFIINTDAGEIVAFGGPLPFYSFNGSNGLSYTEGDTINMRMIYRPGSPGSIEYIVDEGVGSVSSGQLLFSNLEGGIANGSQVGFYAQVTPADPNSDFLDVTFENIMARVPEPSTLVLFSVGAVAGGLMLRRRRH